MEAGERRMMARVRGGVCEKTVLRIVEESVKAERHGRVKIFCL